MITVNSGDSDTPVAMFDTRRVEVMTFKPVNTPYFAVTVVMISGATFDVQFDDKDSAVSFMRTVKELQEEATSD